MSEKVVIIGAGSVGVNISIFLNKMGFDVELIDSEYEILQGAPQVTFVNHGDGFEYFKPNHQRTGKYCIDGSFVKGLIYPLNVFATDICSENNPIRFFVSNDSINKGLVDFNNFKRNALYMQTHFKKQFTSVTNALNLNNEVAKSIFLRTPASFLKELKRTDFKDIANVYGGYAGSSFGINMPHYYAYIKAIISQSNIIFNPSTEIEKIEKINNNYFVHTNSRSIKANFVIISAGHNIPNLSNKITGVDLSGLSGTYYLNCMTFIRLPATTNKEKQLMARHINFTLQADGGGMFACIVSPSDTEDGYAAIYYPSTEGSQLLQHSYYNHNIKSLPYNWDNLINNGLKAQDKSVQRTFEQICTLYPFLKNYAEVISASCRPVFNVSAFSSNKGKDRRVRDIVSSPIMSSSDGRISMWSAPKWTNAEIVALLAVDHINKSLKKEELPKYGLTQFGPTGLDIAKISETINFHNIKMNLADAQLFAERQGLPQRIVNQNLQEFIN